MDAAAKGVLQELEQILDTTLLVDDALDWKRLAEPNAFQSSLTRQPYIVYGDDGIPVDIEYLSMYDPEPEEPSLPARPDPGEFAPSISLLDKLVFRKKRLYEAGRLAYETAIQHWVAERQEAMARFVAELNRWSDAAKVIDRENNQRYQQCIADQNQWREEKVAFDEHRCIRQASVDRFRQAYDRREPDAVERYVLEVLSHSSYPDYFPRGIHLRYHPADRAMEVRIRLIHPDDLPTVASVSYVKSRGDIKSKPLSRTALNALYGKVVKAVCVRTLHEVLESDTADAIDQVLVNGCVDCIEPSTGHDQQAVIASVLTSKAQFVDLRLERVDATSCFDGLGGRGTARGLPKLRAVSPFEFSSDKTTLEYPENYATARSG